MSIDLRRAFTDSFYRLALSHDQAGGAPTTRSGDAEPSEPEEAVELPPNPAGDAELSEAELEQVAGGTAYPVKCKTTTGSCLVSKRTNLLKCGPC